MICHYYHLLILIHGLTKNAFAKLAVKLIPYFDEDSENEIKYKLSEEMLNFLKSWKHLRKSVDEEYTKELYLDSDTENEDENKDTSKSCKNCT